jgi:hypothetical protein
MKSLLVLASVVVVGCSSPTGPSATASPANAVVPVERFTTLSTRDLPPLSPGNQCPSAAADRFEANAQGGGKVLLKFRQVSNEPTVSYVARFTWLSPGTEKHGPEPVAHTEWDVYGFEKAGRWRVDLETLCLGKGTGHVVSTTFAIDGPRAESAPPAECPIVPNTPNCIAEWWRS